MADHTYYARPVFARGTGLGNRLFQWARARSWCYEYGGTMVSPVWVRLSLGHLLRHTVSYKYYLGKIALSGLFQKDPGDASFIASSFLMFNCHIVRESRDSTWRPPTGFTRVFKYFDGRDDSFNLLNKWQPCIKSDLVRIIVKQHLIRANSVSIPPIGLNIRLGKDFAPPPDVSRFKNGYDWIGWLQQTPLEWFMEALNCIRDQAGWCVPAIVVSDGTEDQLSPLLDMPAVSWLKQSNAIVDLLALSRTRLLLASGSSTFSAWAAFLGQQSVITAPGHPFTRLGLKPLAGQFIGAFDPTNPDFTSLDSTIHSLAD